MIPTHSKIGEDIIF